MPVAFRSVGAAAGAVQSTFDAAASPGLVTLAPVVVSRMNAPLGPVVERCTSNPVSLVELSRHETSIRLLDTGAALVLDAAFTEGPDPAVDAASTEGAKGC